MRSFVLVAAVVEPVVVVVVVVGVVVAGRTLAVVVAVEAGGLESGIRPSPGAWSSRIACVTIGCSSGGDEAVWRGLCVWMCGELGRREPGVLCSDSWAE